MKFAALTCFLVAAGCEANRNVTGTSTVLHVAVPVISANESIHVSIDAVKELLATIDATRHGPFPNGGKFSDERFVNSEHELKKMAITLELLKADAMENKDTSAGRKQIQEQLQRIRDYIEETNKDLNGAELTRGVREHPVERYPNTPDGGYEPLYGDHDHGVVEPDHVDHYNTHKVDSYGKVVNEVESFAHDVANDVKSEMQTKTIRSKKAKLDINQKVYIENAAVLGDSAGEASLNVCRAFTAAHVDNPAAPTVKVCGTGIKATVYMRGRCEEYYTHQQVIGKCDSGAPASTCDVFSPAQAAAFGAYQSYKIEQC